MPQELTRRDEGFKGNEKTGYPVTATVIIDAGYKYRYMYYKSPDYKTGEINHRDSEAQKKNEVKF